ncbi:MAG: cobalamin biosynthesis protein [Spirochaetaceae bacterium]|jgi:cobalt-precorrin 5A hydrolase|nr:cobalamin biosynthesis protein [Spirochaetaceae bacterium]
MTASLFSFTLQGTALKNRLSALLAQRGDRIFLPEPAGTLREQAGQAFAGADALIFIGAAGIAVRAVAPFLRSKTTDPAVVAVDEQARWAIPLASGHIGGANSLARDIAALLGAQAVITTATDLNGAFALDLWAKANNLHITSWELAKRFTARILAAETLPLKSDYPITGAPPPNIALCRSEDAPFGALVSLYPPQKPWAHLVPQNLYLGIGCRKGAALSAIERAIAGALAQKGLNEKSVAGVGTLALKKDEAALAEVCEKRGWRFSWYAPETLMSLAGEFSGSPFVMAVTGADNVCERAAVQASCGGNLIIKKFASKGVTVAAAARDIVLSFPSALGVKET